MIVIFSMVWKYLGLHIIPYFKMAIHTDLKFENTYDLNFNVYKSQCSIMDRWTFIIKASRYIMI